ncbi:MAG: hypothetical protein D3923_12150 [Candidatus Electrothrix sp. AR3]|nr:hypothetical protein [Candidatus Electrothrix sp. AR3]
MSWQDEIEQIRLPAEIWQAIIVHCKRKFAGDFLPGESKVNRAFGILAGVQQGAELHIQQVIPVKKNARNTTAQELYG